MGRGIQGWGDRTWWAAIGERGELQMGLDTGSGMTPCAREMWSHYYFQTKPIRLSFIQFVTATVCKRACRHVLASPEPCLHSPDSLASPFQSLCFCHWDGPLESEAALSSFHTYCTPPSPLPFPSQLRFTPSAARTCESPPRWPSLSRVGLSLACHVALVTRSFLDVPGLLFSPLASLWSFFINSLIISKLLSHLVWMICIILTDLSL